MGTGQPDSLPPLLARHCRHSHLLLDVSGAVPCAVWNRHALSPAWQGCLLSTVISLPWFPGPWGTEALPGLGKELGTPSPLSVPVVCVAQGPALQANPGLSQSGPPSLNQSPSLETSLASHTSAERA